MGNSHKSKKRKLFTPVRKLFIKLDLLRPSPTLGIYRQSLPTATNLSSRGPVRAVKPWKPLRVALQNEDPAEDVVVITKLDAVPFCCHEDLLGMSRDKLVAVALSLNAKLPAVLQIDVSHFRPDTFIRHSIELLVGLRREVPPAPKAVKLQSSPGLHALDFNASPPTSPLATKIRPYSPGSPVLARLDEEDEDAMVVDRPTKKRRLSIRTMVIRPSLNPIMESPTPEPRAKSQRSSQGRWVSSATLPTSKRVLRSHRQRFADRMQKNAIRTINMSAIQYPCYDYKTKSAQSNRPNAMTSTHVPTGTFSQDDALVTRRPSQNVPTIYHGEIDFDTTSEGNSLELTPSGHRVLRSQCGPKGRHSDTETEDVTSDTGCMSLALSGSAMEVCEA